MGSILELDNVSYEYDHNTPYATKALCNVDLSIDAGETVVLMGRPGSGKSTLLQLLNGSLQPTQGRVVLHGHDIWQGKKHTQNLFSTVGLVFQYPEHQLFEATVKEDVSFGPRMMGLKSDELDARIAQALAFVGLDPGLAGRSPRSLSTGQKRLVALAGVMAMQPEVLVLDEPTAGLDPSSRKTILEGLQAYQYENTATLVLATHSFEDVAAMTKRVLVLDKGSMVKDAKATDVFRGNKDYEDELASYGLQKPEIMLLFEKLKARGLPLNTETFTVEDATKQIIALFAKKER